MSRRPGTASASASTSAKPQTLDSYIQAAIDTCSPATSSIPKRSRRRRKKLQQESANHFTNFLETKPAALSATLPAAAKPSRRKRRSKLKKDVLQIRGSPQSCKFRVRGLVTVEELEDEDEAEEVQREIRADFGHFGELEDLAIVRHKEKVGEELAADVIVTFKGSKDAASAFSSFDENVFGGKTVTCVWEMQNKKEKSSVVLVQGMLLSEELADPDEVADIQEEVMQIFSAHGLVKELRLSETSGDVTVTFNNERDAEKAVEGMNGSRYGGNLVTARLGQLSGGNGADSDNAKSLPHVEAKRVTTCIIQPTESPELQKLVGEFLKRLADLQERAHTRNPRQGKRSRRFVHGLHEVRRGILSNKLRLLVIATDLNGCDAVAEKYAELVAVATEKEVPTLAPVNRRKLGRVLQKSVRVSCVGVYSAEGANDLFGQIMKDIKMRKYDVSL